MGSKSCVVALVLGLALTGCASTHLYDKQADKLATDAKSGYDESKIVDALKSEHANFDALEMKEVEAFLKVVAARRDLDLLSLLSGSKKPFIDRFYALTEKRLVELMGIANDDDARREHVKQLILVGESVESARNGEARQRGMLVTLDSKLAGLPACEPKNASILKECTAPALAIALEDPKFSPSAAVVRNYCQYLQKGCHELLAVQLKFDKVLANTDGELGRAIGEASTRANVLLTQKAAGEAAEVELKKATKDEAAARKSKDAALAQPDLSCTTEDGTRKDPPNKICAALEKLRKLGVAGIKIASQEHIDKIELVLGALSGYTPPEQKDDLAGGLALLSAGERFRASLSNYRQADTLPALESLLIEKQLQAAKVAFAMQAQALEELRVSLAQERKAALLSEADLILKARAEMGAVRGFDECKAGKKAALCVNASDLLGAADGKGSKNEPIPRSVYRALAYLSESYGVARARFEAADVKLILTDYRDALNRSEYSLASWDALISKPLSQLQAYNASGVKPEEIAQWLQALGLFAVADRVKK